MKPIGKVFGEEGFEKILLLTPLASKRPVLVPESEGFEEDLEPFGLVARILHFHNSVLSFDAC